MPVISKGLVFGGAQVAALSKSAEVTRGVVLPSFMANAFLMGRVHSNLMDHPSLPALTVNL
jgi:hypothetical protein